jgi:ligand-binding sensor domain-containing protein
MEKRFARVQLKVPNGFAGWGWNQLLLEDHEGEWWYATGRGLYRFPKVSSFEQLGVTPPKAIYTKRDGLAGETILRVYEDSHGDVWIGTVDGFGINALGPSHQDFSHLHRKRWPAIVDQVLSDIFLRGQCWGDLDWIKCRWGLMRYRDGRFHQVHFS